MRTETYYTHSVSLLDRSAVYVEHTYFQYIHHYMPSTWWS